VPHDHVDSLRIWREYTKNYGDSEINRFTLRTQRRHEEHKGLILFVAFVYPLRALGFAFIFQNKTPLPGCTGRGVKIG
jgi:hypothetical protein